MTDGRLAEALAATTALEAEARAHFQATGNESEKDQALVLVRHVTAARKHLERWIGVRAMRAQLSK